MTNYTLALLSFAAVASATTLRELTHKMDHPQEIVLGDDFTIEQILTDDMEGLLMDSLGGLEMEDEYDEMDKIVEQFDEAVADEEDFSMETKMEDELLGDQFYEEPQMTIVDMEPEELEELFPEFKLPSPVFETVPGDNPSKPSILTKETYVPMPIMIEPAEVPVEVDEMIKMGEKMDKEAKRLTDDLFYLGDIAGEGLLWWSDIPTMFDGVSDDNLRRAVNTWEVVVDRILMNEDYEEMEGFYYTYDQVLEAATQLIFEGEIEYLQGCFE